MDITDEFILARTTIVDLADGTPVRVRPIVPADKPRIVEGLARLSVESRYLRFLRPIDHLSKEQLSYLTEIDYQAHFAWGAELAGGSPHRGIGLARYVCQTDDPATAEAAVAVLDEYQGRGLGGILLALLAESALENGVERFRSYVAFAESQGDYRPHPTRHRAAARRRHDPFRHPPAAPGGRPPGFRPLRDFASCSPR